MDKNKFILYRHIRPDKDEVFYIGIGKPGRKKETKGRNKYWHNIVNKNNGEYLIEILLEDLSREVIKLKEIEFIKLYGRKDLGLGTLCNLTNGGDGMSGKVFSEETKQKIRLSMLGEKNYRFGKKATKEWKELMSLKMSGKNNPNYNKPLPEWQKEINRKAQLGRKRSEESIKKFKEKTIGQKRNFSEKDQKRMKEKFAKKVINTETKEIFNTLHEAAKSIDLKRTTLGAKLAGQNKNNTKFLYLTDYNKTI